MFFFRIWSREAAKDQTVWASEIGKFKIEFKSRGIFEVDIINV